MNNYLMEIRHFFSGYKHFEIEAENKEDAVEKAKIFVSRNWKYDNCDKNDVRCIKKLKK